MEENKKDGIIIMRSTLPAGMPYWLAWPYIIVPLDCTDAHLQRVLRHIERRIHNARCQGDTVSGHIPA